MLSSPPPKFFSFLSLYHILPIHFPLTLWVFDAPFGRFGRPDGEGSRWWINGGNLAWAAMEIVAPLTMLCNVVGAATPLSFRAKVLVGCYVTHYIHRAIMSPLILSPRRSSIHIIIPLLAGVYNLLNAYCLSQGLMYQPSTLSSTWFNICIGGWLAGLLLNVYHDEVLNDLRRPKDQRKISQYSEEEEKDKKASGGRYAIPRGGLYELVSYPNYLSEWFEWSCFALASAPTVLIPVSAGRLPVIGEFWQPRQLLHPSWMFVVFLLASMMPRAIRGHKWYIRTFGDRYPASRRVVFPWIF